MSVTLSLVQFALSLLETDIKEFIVADEDISDDGKIRRLTIAPLFGEAISRIADESSVSSLFD